MEKRFSVFNSLTKKKEAFKPITPGYIGMYVCGPTVYSDVHLGNCRTFISFDVIYRFLLHMGYKVRYVRNITDVGHLLDDGEDRIMRGARIEQLEPMEVVQKYTNGFHEMMRIFNVLPPSIEPRATGHIIEQIKMVQDILDNDLGYTKNGSVYFDTVKFIEKYDTYGQLSGKVVDDLLSQTRNELKKQDEKNHPSDFAIWIKADNSHIMKWPSPWSEGFPGWHLECSAMSTKYLGSHFDIHGGGNDLKFPHHENEIAQNIGACGDPPADYWLHTNMLLLNGKKMSKSEGNSISPEQLFSGTSEHVSKGYSPMVVRAFMLQAHYRSTLDLTDEALQAAEKGYTKLMEANRYLQGLNFGSTVSSPQTTVRSTESAVNNQQKGGVGEVEVQIKKLLEQVEEDMCDDFNTPKALSRLFELVPFINSHKNDIEPFKDISAESISNLQRSLHHYLFDIFGLEEPLESGQNGQGAKLSGLMELIIDLRQQARSNKDWNMADQIRDGLKSLDIELKDGKEGTSWTLN